VPRTEYVEVRDAGIFTDIDTPEHYRQLLEDAAP
jgi:CTP:molybdopterin cytidylyltransferase MocA